MPKPKKNILIIGASPKEFTLWRQYLQPKDYPEMWLCQAAVHSNTSEQDYFAQQPDCVLLTDSKTETDLLETIARLKSVAGANLSPVLIITEANNEKKVTEALKNGAVNYLFKEELTAHSLRSAVHAVLRYEELRQERDSFRDSVENAPVGIHWVNPDGIILWANQAELSLVGYAREEYFGRNIAEFHADQTVAVSMIEQLSNHETLHNFEAQLRCKDGSCRDVLVSSNVRWENGTFIHTRCFTRDITDRKKIEAELHTRTAQLQLVNDHVTTLIAHCDLAGRYQFVNQAYANQFGLKHEQIIGKTIPEVVGTEAYSEFKPHFDAALLGQRVEFETEIPHQGLSKQYVHTVYVPRFDSHGVVCEVFATINDITKRKLEETNQKLLLEIGERIRRTDNIDELLADVSTLVGKHWEAARCFFSEFDLVQELVTVRSDFYRPDLPSITGIQPLKSLSPATVKELKAGQIVMNANTKTDPRTAATYESFYHPRKLESYVGVPLLRDGHLSATMFINHSSPQEWSRTQISLLETIAERTWLAVEKLRSEKALREAGEKFRTMADNISQFAWMADASGYIFWYNQRWYDYTGTTLEEMQGWGWQQVHHPDHVDRVVAKIQHAWDTGEEWEDTFPLRSKTGEYRWFLSRALPIRDAAGNVVRWFGTNTDITERRQSVEALARQARLIELSFEPILVWDIQHGIVEWNAGAAQLYGFTKEEAIGYTSHELLQTAHPFPFDELIKILKNQGEWVGELHHKTKDGNEVTVESRHQLIEIDGRQVILETNHDITERLQVKAQLEQAYLEQTAARAEAEDANRAKDEFLAVVSHELRAPLNSMLGWAKILKGGKYTPATLDHAIEVIERSARSQQKMIEDLLDSARILSGKLRLEIQPVKMTSVVEATLETVRPAAEAKGLNLEFLSLSDTDIITGDAERLQQVAWNLISNAVKFTPQGGRISVRLERVDPYLQLTVSDTGRGISREFMPYIFNRFHQADSSITRRHSGLGLGLSLVRHLVELHGGTVKAESPGEEQGATFIITLPFRAVLTPVEETVSSRTPRNIRSILPSALDGLHILVVDDELDARELVKIMLEQNGAQVTVAASVAEALSLLRSEEGFRPDAIVSDIGMPEENGYTLIRQVRTLPAAQGGQLPAIALTAFGRASDRIAALSAGFQMHVPKPVEAAELVMVIASLTGRAELVKNG
jgi:PAS domain S-box-containing protein